jgi:hypothetical protein
VRSVCFLCGETLEPIPGRNFQTHPEREDCLVRLTDQHGIAVDEVPEIVRREEPTNDFFEELDIKMFPFVEDALRDIFAKYGLARLGGVSTGRGWSSFSTWQLCRYLYKRRYVEPLHGNSIMPIAEPEARAIGTVIHALLAVYYTRMIVPDYPLTPELLRDELVVKANPEFIHEGWRVFLAYALYYQGENIAPLAIEHDLRDPRTNESCRFDLIAYFAESTYELRAGTYILEHKSSGRFDQATLNWANDGEVIGQVMLWKRLRLDLRYGELKGVIVNILGKQKEPKMHRVIVSPSMWQVDQHVSDLKQNEAEIQVAKATGRFPRSRASCIHRYGLCDLYDHCCTTEDS